MSFLSWLEIYRDYDSDELVKERKNLKEQLDNNYTGQTIGSKSYQRDLGETRDRLRAATRALKERSNSGRRGSVASADFSENCVEDL